MKRLMVLAVVLIAPLAHAQSKTYEIRRDPKNVVQFHAEDTYDKFDGKTNDIKGAIEADAANPSAATVDVSIDLASLDTGVGLRNKEMRERYLETPRHPTARFKSVSVAAPASIAANEPSEMKITGDFTLHGVTKRITVPVRVVLIGDGRVHVTTSFTIKMPDYGIDVPDNILVTVNNEVPVHMDVWAVAK